MKRFLFSIALFLCAGAAIAQQQGQQMNSGDIQELLKRLQRLEEQQNSIKLNAVNEAFRKLDAAAAGGASATNLYESAVKATRFEGKKDDAKNFEEWRSKGRNENRSSSLPTAIQLHLRYLALALKWGASDEKGRVALIPQVKTYLKSLAEAEKTFGRAPLNVDGKKLMEQPMGSSMFVAWMGLAPLLPEPATWEQIPGNVEGILDKTIRPPLRKMKSAELMDLWTQQIQLETERAENQQLELEKEKFKTVRLPQLRWGRAEDGILIGYTRSGYIEMFSIIEANPKHPDHDKWIQAMTALLTKAVTPAPSSEAPGESAAASPPSVPDSPLPQPASATLPPAPATSSVAPALAPTPTATPGERNDPLFSTTQYQVIPKKEEPNPGANSSPVPESSPSPVDAPAQVAPVALPSPVSTSTPAPVIPSPSPALPVRPAHEEKL